MIDNNNKVDGKITMNNEIKEHRLVKRLKEYLNEQTKAYLDTIIEYYCKQLLAEQGKNKKLIEYMQRIANIKCRSVEVELAQQALNEVNNNDES